jgi:hypothetical protein
MKVEGTAVDGTGTGSVCVGVIEPVYGEMGLNALERVHVGSPFNKCETIKHGKNTDINAIILQSDTHYEVYLSDMVVEFTKFDTISNGCVFGVSSAGIDGTSLCKDIIGEQESILSQ